MTDKPRVFVSQPIASSALERLRAIATVKINTDSSQIIAKPKLIAAMKKCDILFSLLHDKIDRAVLAANPKLRAVCSMSITPDNIDVAEATKRGIPVTVVAADRRGGDGRHPFRIDDRGGAPDEGRRPPWCAPENSQARSPTISPARYVHGKTIGLVGAGRIGQATARRARGFGMRIIYWGPRRKYDAERELGIEHVTLDRLLANPISCRCIPPLNAETRHMISDKQFALMKPTAFIINTARGAIIDEKALVRALKKKKIAGAGLDVFEHEPKIPPALKAHEERGGHAASWQCGMEVREQMANIVVDNIQALIDGRTPPNCVNPEVLEKKA